MQKYMSLLFVLFVFVPKIVSAETFKVAVPFLSKFNPITNQVNLANYVGMHLYYPLFEEKSDGALKSNFLDLNISKALSQDFMRYDLCLKEKVLFLDSTEIEVSDFLSSFSLMAKMYPHLLPLKAVKIKSSRCLAIEMKYATPNLFRRLTGIASTIVKRAELNSDFPTGLGPYKLSAVSDAAINLQYSGALKPRFDKISFVKVLDSKTLSTDDFHDLNQLPRRLLDTAPTDNLSTYEVSIPKMYSIILNLKGKDERLCAASLLSRVDWVKGYRLSALPWQNFLPWRNPNSSVFVRPVSKNCKPGAVDLYVPDLYQSAAVVKSISDAGLGGRIRLIKQTNDEFERKIFSGEEYIGLLGFDSTTSVAMLEGDYSTYFESFFSDKNRIVLKENAEIQRLVSKATKMDTPPKERKELFERAEALLTGGGFVLPVGSLKKQYQFHKGISVTSWFDYVNGVPNVSLIQ